MSGMQFPRVSLGQVLKARWGHFTWRLRIATIEVKAAFGFLFRGAYVNGIFVNDGGAYQNFCTQSFGSSGEVFIKNNAIENNIIFAGIAKDIVDTTSKDVGEK